MPALRACVAAAAVVLFVSGCGPKRTSIRLRVPPDTLARITRVEIDVFSATAGVCTGVGGFRLIECGTGQPCPTYDRDVGEVVSALMLEPESPEVFGPAQIELGNDDVWEVRVIAELDDDPSNLLYGCRTVREGGEEPIVLWFPSCRGDEAVCEDRFAAGCAARLACQLVERDGQPQEVETLCEAQRDRTYLWQQEGEPCDVAAAAGANEPEQVGICRTAEVVCALDDDTVVTDGVCPDLRTPEPRVCDVAEGYDPDRDFNCDRGHPGCDDSSCPMPGEVQACGIVCVGNQVCQDDGTWGACVFSAEICDGLDNDCDRAVDEEAPRCTGGLTPVGDRCGPGGCVCGAGGAPCLGLNRACCDGACVDVASSDAHCGACGDACDPGLECRGSFCVDIMRIDAGVPMVDAGVQCATPTDCRRFQGRADTCDARGLCVCGSSNAPCGPDLTCCGGQCVDVLTDELNCGDCRAPLCRGTCLGGDCLMR